MKTRLVSLALMVLVAACGAAGEPDAPATDDGLSPQATVQAMLAAAQSGDWETYVDDFYGEKEKFGSPSDRDALVGRFRDQWGAQVIPGLEAASQVEPTLSEDGQRAVFALETGEFVLYRGADGKWGFHL